MIRGEFCHKEKLLKVKHFMGKIPISSIIWEIVMSRNKWDEFGNGMNDIIQKAIDSGNYNSLGRDVNDLIRKAAYTFEDALNKGLNEARNKTVKTNLGGNTGQNKKT